VKIAITADVHLKTRTQTPQRYNALEQIFLEIKKQNITTLIIAGDTFDKEANNYSDFNNLCEQHKNINIIIIPGNHDPQIGKKYFPLSNIEIINKTELRTFSDLSILFVPYIQTKTMDEEITEFFFNNSIPQKWILISHGDYNTKERHLNSYESGIYMPISGKLINKYKPLRVFLGHIHKSSVFGSVIYPGSPCGLDINETGKRQFIIYDSVYDNITSKIIPTDILYYKETIITFPLEDEIDLIKASLNKMITNWQLTNEELKKVKLRLEIIGFTKDLSVLKNNIDSFFNSKKIEIYDPQGINVSKVRVLNTADEDRIAIMNKFREKIEQYSFDISKTQILESGLNVIFGEKNGY
jgi:DNA repair exonuclease SbcCD nuclease subunit